MFTYVQILFSNFPYTQCNLYIYIHTYATKNNKTAKIILTKTKISPES